MVLSDFFRNDDEEEKGEGTAGGADGKASDIAIQALETIKMHERLGQPSPGAPASHSNV
jgi:hypothetical protein